MRSRERELRQDLEPCWLGEDRIPGSHIDPARVAGDGRVFPGIRGRGQ